MPAKIDRSKIQVDKGALKTAADKKAKLDELLVLGNAFYAEMGNDLDNPSKEEYEYISDLNKAAEELDSEIKMSADFQEQLRKHQEFYGNRGDTNLNPPGYGGTPGTQGKSIGERFAASSEFKQFIEEKKGKSEHISDGVSIEGMVPFAYGKKDIITGASPTSAGAMVRRDYYGLVPMPWPKLVLRDLVTSLTTNSDLIEYPREISRTNAAKVVREATSAADSQTALVAGLKPESAFALEKVTAPVKTIAHMIPVTRRALSDAPQIQGLIDNFLETGLEQALENELINGDNTEDHLLGLENMPGRGLQPFTTDVLTTTRKARTKVEQVGLEIPQAYLMNPYDWEEIELTKDGQGRYYYGGPSVLGNPMLWGLPVVVSPFVPKATAWVGNFKRMIVWDREQNQIRVTDAHKDWFQRNLVAILAEMRVANGCLRPIALYQVDLQAGANS